MIKSLFKAFGLLFLLSLPITNFPIVMGTVSGIIFAVWNARHVTETSEKFIYAAKDVMNDWGVGGGAPTFRDYQDTHNYFHLMRVNSNDWITKLNFHVPDHFTDLDGIPTADLPIDSYATLDFLMRDVSCGPNSKETWLYLSTWAGPIGSDWDRAFNHVIETAYVHPKLNVSAFYFATCMDTGDFLCSVWHTRSPALVHFVVEDDPVNSDDLQDDFTYSPSLENLRMVTARIIEFPLEDAYTGLPSSTFPDAKAQMLSIIAGDRLYEQFEPYNAMNQMLKRFGEHVFESFWEVPATWANTYNNADSWVVRNVHEPLGIKELMQGLHMLVFQISAILSASVLAIGRGIWLMVEDFMGRPKAGDRILGDMDAYKDPEENFWGPMMGDFWDFVDKKVAEEQRESYRGDGRPVTTTPPVQSQT